MTKSLKLTLFFYSILVLAAKAQPQPLQLFPLNEVNLLNSPFRSAEETDLRYMLQLNPDRLLAPFLREAKLPAKAKSYGNWENTGLDGHTAGHYLTALAQMYAATGSKVCKKRLDYMISEIARCQATDQQGYVGGIPGGIHMWASLKKGDFGEFNQKWVPWYNLHKLFAGLRDSYLLTGNEEAKSVLIKMTDWVAQELAPLDVGQIQRMLGTEQGGMNEVCADVFAITADQKYLDLAKKFCQLALLKPLENHRDELNGLHANTQIPKVIGFERIGELMGDSSYTGAAKYFWETVVDHRTISIGGNSVREHFNPAGNFATMLESEQGPETCNSNNMLKLTKMLFTKQPGERYMGFYERLLYNHILSSQHPGKGGFVYFTPIHPQHYRVYSMAEESFWCCVGTGMENHGKYGELIYAHDDNALYVNLFIPSQLSWRERGMKLTQLNHFPEEERTRLLLTLAKPQEFPIAVRKPSWVTESGFSIKINGLRYPLPHISGDYVKITRRWKSGDRITVELPMKDFAEQLPDHSSWVSFRHGPVVLAAMTDTTGMTGLFGGASRWGHIASGKMYPLTGAPLITTDGGDLSHLLTKGHGAGINFMISDHIVQPEFKNLKLVPFYQLHDSRYVLYWPVTDRDSVKYKIAELQALDDRYLKFASRTIDVVFPGEQQPESDHSIAFKDSETGIFRNQHWRRATGFFSYRLKSGPAADALLVTYYGKERNCEFDIMANEIKVAHVVLDGSDGDNFRRVQYNLPETVKKGGEYMLIKFVAVNASETPAVYEVRVLR